MPVALTMHDETATGIRLHQITVEFPCDQVTVRELIRGRVYEEVADFNRRKPEYFQGLVQPTDAEVVLNGYRLRKARALDWHKQFDEAVDAFKRNGFLLLVDNRQPEDLEERVTITSNTKVSFVKLTPLVGG